MEDLLKELMERGISISLDQHDIKVRFNDGALPEKLIKKIKENKEFIIQYLLRLNDKTSHQPVGRVDTHDCYPLSSSQLRLWILSQLDEGNIAYNIPGAYLLEGDLKPESLLYSFNTLVERHEALRTVFKANELGEPKQFVLSVQDCGFRIETLDLRGKDDREQFVKDLIRRQSFKPFDLSSGPLLRVALYRLEDNKWVFVYVIHHIISDGWSINLLIRELSILYNAHSKGKADPLPPLRLQYRDYATWQQEQLIREIEGHKAYWLRQFEGALPAPDLFFDRPRPPVRTYNGDSIDKVFDAEIFGKLQQLLHEQGSTLFMGLISLVNLLLYTYTGQKDIIIGSPIAGREHIDLEDQIGFYVNTIALRIRFNEEDSFADLLREVKKVTLDAYEHQVYPFDELVNKLNLRRDPGRNVLFDVWVVLHNTNINTHNISNNMEGLKWTIYAEEGQAFSRFDLSFAFKEQGGDLMIDLVYNKDIVSRKYAEDLIDKFETILRHIAGHPSGKLLDIAIHVSNMEKEKKKEISKTLKLKNLINLLHKKS
jgi:Condensation domain/TubC N-terminal docking domain